MNNENNNSKLTTKIFKKQTTEFTVTNYFVGTKKLSDILASLALAEINKTIADNEKNLNNPA